MASSQDRDDEELMHEDIQEKDMLIFLTGHAKQLKELYPDFSLNIHKDSCGAVLVSIEPLGDFELKVDIYIPNTQGIPFALATSKFVSKRELQHFQRSLELQISTISVYKIVDTVVDMMSDFVKAQDLCNREDRSLTKHEKKKKKTAKDSDSQEEKLGNKGSSKKSKRRLRRYNQDESDSDISEKNYLDNGLPLFQVESTGIGANISAISITHRPTHFLAMRVTNKSILEKLEAVQKTLVSIEPLLEKGVFSTEIFHVTLLTLGLDTDEDVKNCVQALQSIALNLETERPKNPLIVWGISQFYNRAVFAKVVTQGDFVDFSNSVRNQLENLKVEIRDQYETYNPHVTILKVKRPERKLFGSRNIQPAWYSYCKDERFGEQTVNDLHLCAMDGQRRHDGFYRTLFSFTFHEDSKD